MRRPICGHAMIIRLGRDTAVHFVRRGGENPRRISQVFNGIDSMHDDDRTEAATHAAKNSFHVPMEAYGILLSDVLLAIPFRIE